MPNHDAATNLVVVANRLPIRRVPSSDGSDWATSPGGLVSALIPVLRDSGGVWIGWSGDDADDDALPEQHDGIALSSVALSTNDYEEFYLGFANATLWPLYHDAIRPATFERAWWRTYVAVNQRYADAAARRRRRVRSCGSTTTSSSSSPGCCGNCGPMFGSASSCTSRSRRGSSSCSCPGGGKSCRGCWGPTSWGSRCPGRRPTSLAWPDVSRARRGTDSQVEYQGRTVRIGAFPISVDAAELTTLAHDSAVRARARELRSELGNPELVLLGVDRLDYTKGIDRRVRAVGELFAEGTLSASRHVMVQIAVPSREDDGHYQREREHLEQLVGEVNGEHANVGRPPIHYLHQTVPLEELVALYLTADVMLVTPLRDGMNLVAKEYVACRTDATGTLVLSEFAGAARELRGALLVNPHDLDGLKDTIRDSLTLDARDVRAHMLRMRRVVRRHDVHAWADAFLATLRDRNAWGAGGDGSHEAG